jgi:uncharacterized protein YcgI (DUF1989 family)
MSCLTLIFSKVTAESSGELVSHTGNSKAGDYVDLSFEMDTLMVLSAAPHPLDQADTYRPGAVPSDAVQGRFGNNLCWTQVSLPLLLYSETHLADGPPTGISLKTIQ